MNADGYLTEKTVICDVTVSIESYKIGDTFYCHVASVDPGATIARTRASTRGGAVELAMTKALERIRQPKAIG